MIHGYNKAFRKIKITATTAAITATTKTICCFVLETRTYHQS